jgi:hypothetical protein
MPAPPFHALSVLWLSFKREKYFDPLALILSSIILDLEPFLVLALGLPCPDHGFWHSYFAGVIVSFLITPVFYVLENRLKGEAEKTCGFLRLKFRGFPYSVRLIFLNFLLGTTFHVFLDSFTHQEMSWVLFPFYISGNPFWVRVNVEMIVNSLAIVLCVISALLWTKSYRSIYSRPTTRRLSQES